MLGRDTSKPNPILGQNFQESWSELVVESFEKTCVYFNIYIFLLVDVLHISEAYQHLLSYELGGRELNKEITNISRRSAFVEDVNATCSCPRCHRGSCATSVSGPKTIALLNTHC